jgi:hypothetical protein
MNGVEERLRAALRAHAEEFTAHPDAWRQLTARRRRRGGPRLRSSRFSGPALIPLAAAAAVLAVISAAILVVHGISGGTGKTPETGVSATPTARPASTSASPRADQPSGGHGSGPAVSLLAMHPPLSAVVHVRVPGIVKKVHGQAVQVTSYFWRARNNPAFWPGEVNPGPQLCNDLVNDSTGQSAPFCLTAPEPGPGYLAAVTDSGGIGTDQTIMAGQAVARVASVSAVLPGGHAYHGVVTTGRGLPGTVWAVSYPWSAGASFTQGAHLVFMDASGKQVTVLDPHSPVGPIGTAQPSSGGVALFSYQGSSREPAGTVRAFLISGEVGFWSPTWGGAISQQLAADAPVLGGLTESFVFEPGSGFTLLEALGYAHAGVARVVLRADGRQLASVTTLAAGWPGSSLRLWHVQLPLSAQGAAARMSAITAIAYDAAGHVLGQVKLGQMA